jgi:hypothetical protein
MIINGQYRYGYIPSKWNYQVGNKSASPCDKFSSNLEGPSTFTPGILVNPRLEVTIDYHLSNQSSYLLKEIFLKVSNLHKVRLNPLDVDRLVYNYSGFTGGQLLGKYALAWFNQAFLLPIDSPLYDCLSSRNLRIYKEYKLGNIYRNLLGYKGYLYCGQYNYWLFKQSSKKDCVIGIPHFNESIFLISDVLLEAILNSSSGHISKNSLGAGPIFNSILGTTSSVLVEELGPLTGFDAYKYMDIMTSQAKRAYLNNRNLDELSISTYSRGKLQVPEFLETISSYGDKELIFKIRY